MPSTLVHVGFAGLIGAAMLSDRFDVRSIGIVMIVAALPDLDTFIGLWIMDGAHRTVLHNLFLPFLILGLIVWDGRYRNESTILNRWGEYGYRVAWVSIIGGWIIAHVLLDAFFNGVNLFWPFYDQFIDLSGFFVYTTDHGWVMTFIEIERTADGWRIAEAHLQGSSRERHYITGVDPGPGGEKIFPIAESGILFVTMMTGYLVVGIRLIEQRLSRG